MKLHKKKRIASRLLGVGQNKVKFDTERLEDVSGALTRRDISSLIKQGAIKVKPHSRQSKVRHRKKLVKKRKGRTQNTGSRKGSKKARNPPKKVWMIKIRSQRSYVQKLKTQEKISLENYRILKSRSKGGFFRSLRHLKLFVQESGMIKEKDGK
jgi:large subunit ribosomal protein L19e